MNYKIQPLKLIAYIGDVGSTNRKVSAKPQSKPRIKVVCGALWYTFGLTDFAVGLLLVREKVSEPLFHLFGFKILFWF
jgi:hypothetical protein